MENDYSTNVNQQPSIKGGGGGGWLAHARRARRQNINVVKIVSKHQGMGQLLCNKKKKKKNSEKVEREKKGWSTRIDESI
jgi:hypothetical protein